jgi:hypothetical protein
MSDKTALLVTEKEKRLIEELRKVEYGKVVVFMEASQPQRIERTIASIKLAN